MRARQDVVDAHVRQKLGENLAQLDVIQVASAYAFATDAVRGVRQKVWFCHKNKKSSQTFHGVMCLCHNVVMHHTGLARKIL